MKEFGENVVILLAAVYVAAKFAIKSIVNESTKK
jgi:hypothetical protein